jgi:L-fucose isomerase-like protein
MLMRTERNEDGEEIDGFILITTRGDEAIISTSFEAEEAVDILFGAAESIEEGGGFNQIAAPTIQ